MSEKNPTDAAPQTEPQANDENDADAVVNLLLPKPEEPAKAEKEPDPAPTRADEPLEKAETTVDEPPAEQPGSQQPAPGTPDKVLQKLQQDFAGLTRKQAEIEAKLADGEPLTPKEQQAVQQMVRKLDQLRERVKGQQFDPYEHSADVVEALSETDATVATLAKKVAQLEAEKQQTETEVFWTNAERDYAGIEVRKVGAKAIEDAQEILGDDAPPATVQKLATRLFHDRAAAAAKSLKAKAPAPETAPPAKNKPGPPVTPGGATVTVPTTPQVMDEREREMGLIAALVKRN